MKYRKKPVVVEAEEYKPGMEDGFDKFCSWKDVFMKDDYDCDVCCSSYKECQGENMVKLPYINTLEGKHYISPGDYIITDVKCERYPYKPNIFEMTYEQLESDSKRPPE